MTSSNLEVSALKKLTNVFNSDHTNPRNATDEHSHMAQFRINQERNKPPSKKPKLIKK